MYTGDGCACADEEGALIRLKSARLEFGTSLLAATLTLMEFARSGAGMLILISPLRKGR